VDHHRLHRDVEVLTPPGAAALVERDQDVSGGLHAGVERRLGMADRDRRAITVTLER
jgi:hypothetical protein